MTPELARRISTGNSAVNSPLAFLQAAQVILAGVRALTAKAIAGPPTCKWVAVCWDFDECAFSYSSLRQEPEQGDDPSLFRNHYWFPWVYLPAAHGTLDGIQRLNQQCHWQRNTQDIADIVHGIGGRMLWSEHLSFGPNTTHTPRHREPNISRVRSQPQRYTRSLRQSRNLAALASNNRQRTSQALIEGLRESMHGYKHSQRPVPTECYNWRPASMERGETDDDVKNRYKLETWADEICRCLSQKWERELQEQEAAHAWDDFYFKE